MFIAKAHYIEDRNNRDDYYEHDEDLLEDPTHYDWEVYQTEEKMSKAFLDMGDQIDYVEVWEITPGQKFIGEQVAVSALGLEPMEDES
jgi:hypothetical protein